MEFLIGLFFGLVLMFAFDYVTTSRKKPSGTFIIDFRDPEKDVCKIELEESIEDIYDKTEIILRVKTFESSQY